MSLLEALLAKKSGLKVATTKERVFDPLALHNDVVIVMGNSPGKRGLRILCFGDSLTWGFIGPYGLEQHPYANKLAELIKNDFPEQPSIEVIAKGVSGERTQKMAARLEEELEKDSDYDAMILLGGTNDVGDKMPEQTVNNLKNMQSTAAKHKIDFFVGTLPPAKADEVDWVLEVKTQINNGIKTLVLESHLNDFATEIPMHALSEEERKKIWSDQLHLTEEGYDLMAEIIYKKLKVALELFLKGKVSEKRKKIDPKA
eukprot:TRINITY_DN9325_c0_g1_i1.p1 TRINITY_DN9325_c0_g1~~TRINITY_DN9325_c0_g1_i1.p1  ORF type:complete len:258 (+),score=35.33 TRINITY_DN9325_c0_g1_i1:55-828(+)